MALSGNIKNFRSGSLTATDDTGTPLSLTFIYEPGDFSADSMVQGGKEVADYKDRGDFQTLAFTNQLYPTFSVTVWATEMLGATGAGNIGFPDLVLKLGGFAAGVSTLGTATALPWTVDLVFTMEGTDYGDSADSTLSFDDCRLVLSFAEGDPNQFVISGTCYGAYAPA